MAIALATGFGMSFSNLRHLGRLANSWYCDCGVYWSKKDPNYNNLCPKCFSKWFWNNGINGGQRKRRRILRGFY